MKTAYIFQVFSICLFKNLSMLVPAWHQLLYIPAKEKQTPKDFYLKNKLSR